MDIAECPNLHASLSLPPIFRYVYLYICVYVSTYIALFRGVAPKVETLGMVICLSIILHYVYILYLVKR